MKTCFYCQEEIEEGEGRIVPLDRPYANLWVHRKGCADNMTQEYLNKNINKIHEYIKETGYGRVLVSR